MIHLGRETIITVSVRNKRMKILIHVFAEKNVKDSRDFKLIKDCKVKTLADTKSLFDSPPMSENLPVEDLSFDEIIPEKVTTLNDIKLLKTIEPWLHGNAYFSATLPYNDDNITDAERTLEEFQKKLYTYFRHNYGEHQNQSI